MSDNDRLWFKYAGLLKQHTPKVNVCVFYPETELTLSSEGITEFLNKTSLLRDIINFDLVDEKMIIDNVLEKYKVLMIIDSELISRNTLDKIAGWCKEKNGVVITNKKLKFDKNLIDKNKVKKGKTTVEKIADNVGTGTIVTYKTSDLRAYYKIVYRILNLTDDVVKLASPVIDDLDGEPDKVYAAVTTDNEILFYNDNETEKQKKYVFNGKQETVKLDPYSIKLIK
jgi:hypothetical protein